MLPEREAFRKAAHKTEILNVSGKFHMVFGISIMTAGVQLPPLANGLSLPDFSCKTGKSKPVYRCIDVFSWFM